MKILVLGNGFDLDHNLPTSYMDFLHFCNYVVEGTEKSFKKLNDTQQKYVEELKNKKIKKLKINKKVKINKRVKINKIIKHNKNGLNPFLPLLKKNRLLKYFNSRVTTQGENWIDFEREIKSVVNEFKAIESEFRQSNQYSYKIDKNHKINIILKDLGLDSHIKELWGENELFIIHQKLCYSLDNFSKALEYYISLLINNTPIKGCSPDIVDFGADKVITFNYSNTYERVYGGIRRNEDVDYVHGVASVNFNNTPNIILGITTNNEKSQNYYVEFEKYFQRITKKTGNEYKKWLQRVEEKNETMEVVFFGHSLDSADSDIIKDLIAYDNSIVKIYYFDERSHQQIVANLIEILKKDDLIDFVSGSNPKIEFIQQRTHRDDNTAGIEITRDINALYRPHSLSNTAIKELIDRIKVKIKLKDLSYFYSQKKVISFFDALNHNWLEDLTFTQNDSLKICEKLNFEINKIGKLVLYNEYEWDSLSTRVEDIACELLTESLVNAVNSSNEKRFQEYKLSRPYAEILKLKSSEEVKDFLLKLFEQDCPYNDYSKHLREFFKPMYENKNFFEEVFQLIENAKLSLSTKVKFRCFKKDYDEYVDNIELEANQPNAENN